MPRPAAWLPVKEIVELAADKVPRVERGEAQEAGFLGRITETLYIFEAFKIHNSTRQDRSSSAIRSCSSRTALSGLDVLSM